MTSIFPKGMNELKVNISHGSFNSKIRETNAAIEQMVDSIQIKKVRGVNQKRASQQQQWSTKKSKLTETEHTPGVDLRTMLKDTFDNENPFKTPRKVPALRKTPAVIRWPERPPCKAEKMKARQASIKQDDITYQSGEATPINRETASSRKSSKQEEKPAKMIKKKSVKASNKPKSNKSQGSDDELSDNSDEEEETASPWRPVAYGNFWDTAVGNYRMDEVNMGSPRVDPHHSTWTPVERKCYFLHQKAPPHIRSKLPLSSSLPKE